MTAALLLPASYLLVACCTCVGAFLGFVVGAVAIWLRMDRACRVAYAAGRLDERAWRHRVFATYSEGRPAGLRVVRGGGDA